MANSISARSSIFVQFTIDTNAAGGATVSLLCNRDYLVVDAQIVNGTADAISGSVTNTTAAGAVTTISTINAVAAGTIVRPTLVGAPGAGLINLDTANNTVLRGSTVKVIMTAAGDFCTGFLTVLPGNRYSAVTSPTAYYANNTASGNNNGTVSI